MLYHMSNSKIELHVNVDEWVIWVKFRVLVQVFAVVAAAVVAAAVGLIAVGISGVETAAPVNVVVFFQEVEFWVQQAAAVPAAVHAVAVADVAGLVGIQATEVGEEPVHGGLQPRRRSREQRLCPNNNT